MRKLPTFYGKVTEFLKPYNLEGFVACVIRGRRMLKLVNCFLHYFVFLVVVNNILIRYAFIFGTRIIILFSHRYSQMDTDFYHEDEYVLNTNITNLTLIFWGTQIESGFYRADGGFFFEH